MAGLWCAPILLGFFVVKTFECLACLGLAACFGRAAYHAAS